MVDVKWKWAFITGASRGIGKLTAFMDDKKSGRFIGAQEFVGMDLESAVKLAEEKFSKSVY